MTVAAQVQTHLDAIAAHTAAIAALLPQLEDGNAPEPSDTPQSGGRNPVWFRPSGHLSDDGIARIYDLYDQGYSVERAAVALGISLSGAAARYRSWRKLRGR